MTAAVAAGASMDCPTCHLPSRTPYWYKTPIVPDYVAEHFLAVSDRGQASHVCGVHEEDPPEPATFCCTACSVFMCSICPVEHRQHASFFTHTPVLLEDLTPEMVRVPVTCPSHGKDQLISGFCTACRVGVCSTCMTGDHHTHVIVTDGLDTSVYAEACRTLDEELARPVPPSKLDGVAATLRTLDELLAAGTANVKTQHAVIDEWARDGSAAVIARAEVLRGEVVAKWDVRRKALATQRRDVARRVHAFEQACAYTTALCRIGSPCEVLMVSTFIKRRLRALRSWLRPIEPCVSRDPITVTLNPAAEGVKVVTLGHVSDPRMRLWQQGHPPHSVHSDGRIYIVGGATEDVRESMKVGRYDPASDAWEEMEPRPRTVMSWLGCAVFDNRLYVLGARDRKSVVEVFDPAARSSGWTSAVVDGGVWRHHPTVVTLGDYIFVIGGNLTIGPRNTVDRYDVRATCWEARATMAHDRGTFASAVLDDYIYAIGGANVDGFVLASVERYDPTRDCWERIQDMPIGRRGHAAAVLEGYIYVMGGDTSGEYPTADVDRFNPARHEWERVTPLAVGRRLLTAVTTDERIYAIGGQKANNTIANDVEVYDTVRTTWVSCEPMPVGRSRFAAGVLTDEEP